MAEKPWEPIEHPLLNADEAATFAADLARTAVERYRNALAALTSAAADEVWKEVGGASDELSSPRFLSWRPTEWGVVIITEGGEWLIPKDGAINPGEVFKGLLHPKWEGRHMPVSTV